MRPVALLRLLSLTVALVLLVSACSSSDSTTTPTDDHADADDGATAVDDDTGAATEPVFAGLDGSVTLLTDPSGGGPRPLLEWEPVADADHYVAYLYAPDGGVYWVWTGYDTSVHVGGNPQLRDDAAGPSVVEGMTWAVTVHDSDGLPLAVSEQRPIGP